VNRRFEALVAGWRKQAEDYVRQARRSTSLRDIVRLIAMASTLEHAARRVCSGADVNLSEIARMTGLEVYPGTSHSGLSTIKRSTHHAGSHSAER
jgi:hypothetical protein